MSARGPGPLRASVDRVLVDLQAQPGARSDEIVGLHGERLRVRTSQPPADGKANASLARLVAELFGVPARSVELVAGASSRRKTFAVSGLTLGQAEQRLEARLATSDKT